MYKQTGTLEVCVCVGGGGVKLQRPSSTLLLLFHLSLSKLKEVLTAETAYNTHLY